MSVIKRVDCSTMSCIIVLQYYEHIIGRAEGGDHWHNRLHLVALENSINFGDNKCGRAYSLVLSKQDTATKILFMLHWIEYTWSRSIL